LCCSLEKGIEERYRLPIRLKLHNTEDFSSSKKVISSGTRTVVSRVKLDTNSRNWK